MAIRQVKVRGKKRWQARVAYHGAWASRLCDSKEAAKQESISNRGLRCLA